MLDLVGSGSLSDWRRALTPRGTYVVVGVKEMGRWFGLARQLKALSLSPFVGQQMRVFVVKHNKENLAVLKELVEAGKVAPVIDRHYTLSDVPEALRYQGEGHAQGKLVIVMCATNRRPLPEACSDKLRQLASCVRRSSRSRRSVARCIRVPCCARGRRPVLPVDDARRSSSGKLDTWPPTDARK